MSEYELPEDPEDGQLFELPEGNADNYSGVIALYCEGTCIGYTEKIDTVPNISGMTELGRSVLSKRLSKGAEITAQFEVILIRSLVFVNFFGWQAGEYSKEVRVDWQKNFKVLHAVEIPDRPGTQIICEKICVEKTKETRQ